MFARNRPDFLSLGRCPKLGLLSGGVEVTCLKGGTTRLTLSGWAAAGAVTMRGSTGPVRQVGAAEYELTMTAGETVCFSQPSSAASIVVKPLVHAAPTFNPYGLRVGASLDFGKTWPETMPQRHP